MNELEWLLSYYEECCNGDWEHTYGIAIETLDNPGWRLRVDVADTDLEDATFPDFKELRSEHNWVICRLEERAFRGSGGPRNLAELIGIFRKWVAEQDALKR